MPVEAESVSLEPAQMAPVPVEEMLTVGGVFTVTAVAVVVTEQPSALVSVTL
tara:strand:- start:187 stop:342 length:156 start_codon:yes stop_codon:yes gene_type:complete